MALEKQRGISITSTVLQFEYAGHVLNLLDTPGHEDFSEDTYRTLVAADSAVMLIDNARGVEAQTKKTVPGVPDRGIPIFTFVNKLDRPGREPLELMAELEDVLGIRSAPVNWPIGDGDDFRGVYDRLSGQVHLFARTEHGARPPRAGKGPERPGSGNAARTRRLRAAARRHRTVGRGRRAAGRGTHRARRDHAAVFRQRGHELRRRVVFGPVFDDGARPGPRPATSASSNEPRLVCPEEPEFRGFIFKVQANMDPNHRDRIAFLRVVSGRFERDMTVQNARLNKPVRLTRPQKLFAQERVVMDEAFPGDIIGLTNPGVFAIGDTVAAGGAICALAASRAFCPNTSPFCATCGPKSTSSFKRASSS
jgi:peptide chain release factor 3